MKKHEINADNFWTTDLEDIESVFLPEGTKITDLPITNCIPVRPEVKPSLIGRILKVMNRTRKLYANPKQ